MRSLRLSTLGGYCAIAAVVCFVVGGGAMGSSGVSVLIPQTGREGREWIADVDAAGALFYAGAWLVVLMGFLGVVAYLGLYDALKEAGPAIVLAPITAAVGLTLVTVSHLLPIAMAYELVPAYVAAEAADKDAIAVTADTLAASALVLNSAGNFLGWGVATPLVSAAILATGLLPRWIGWLGIAVAVLAGWVGLLAPASGVAEAVSSLGFLAFFVFLLSGGIALVRRRVEAPTPASTPA